MSTIPPSLPPTYRSRGLESLPWVILFEIAILLDDRDFVHLSRLSRTLTHESVATAAPYSVAILAYGTDFLYNQGMLCYRIESEIRLLDAHAVEKRERVLGLSVALQSVSPESMGADAVGRVSLLRYADNILVFRVHAENDRADNNWAGDDQSENDLFDDDLSEDDLFQPVNDRALRDLIVVVDMTSHLIRFSKQIPLKTPVFVRQSDTYLWYGIFRATDISNGRWIVYGVDLRAAEPEPIETFRIQAANGALDQSVCFEIAPGEKSDKLRVCNRSLWRREHSEGSINEWWANMSIRTDEITGRPVILECRREWAGNRREHHRTYYSQPLPIPEEFLAETGEEAATDEFESDPLESELSNRHRNEHRPAKRLRHEFHAEYEPADSPEDRQEFIRARTRHCSYNLAACTYIDLVNDPLPNRVRLQERLRLRTRSRNHEDFIDEKDALLPHNLLSSTTKCNEGETPITGLKKRYDSHRTYLWPPENASVELRRLLCPPSSFKTLRAVSDERSMVYSVRYPNLPANYRALVLVSFDPQIGFSFLSALDDTKDFHKNHRFPSLAMIKSPEPSLLRETNPLYEHIQWGDWLR
ncbi:hypothetical protein N7520_001593 [Penicillium odoratum]|uniref:uncharacterized protein n=1 Tax=Penicillium odoratum TaxID=1167516 RepID=UPI002549519A|nr:uncharacterized protein N7520_001593 [Penicillium odoratum]KAJ5778347.1 hypothetical protein N7520_001593 [Penicillium odoratum]